MFRISQLGRASTSSLKFVYRSHLTLHDLYTICSPTELLERQKT